jgi:hypothetical protein
MPHNRRVDQENVLGSLRLGGSFAAAAVDRAAAVMPSSPLRVAVVCSSNQNRSVEAHNILSKRGVQCLVFWNRNSCEAPRTSTRQAQCLWFQNHIWPDVQWSSQERQRTVSHGLPLQNLWVVFWQVWFVMGDLPYPALQGGILGKVGTEGVVCRPVRVVPTPFLFRCENPSLLQLLITQSKC